MAVTVSFFQPIFKNQICPFIFKKSMIESLSFAPIIDTFFWQNVPRFSNDISNQTLDIRIYRLSLQMVENVNIDSTLINKDIFKEVRFFYIFGDIRSIDDNVFVSMDKILTITIQNIKRISHKQGIKWMANIRLI